MRNWKQIVELAQTEKKQVGFTIKSEWSKQSEINRATDLQKVSFSLKVSFVILEHVLPINLSWNIFCEFSDN